MNLERIVHVFDDDRSPLIITETLALDVAASAREPVKISVGSKSIKLDQAQVVDLRDTLNTIVNRQYGIADLVVRTTHTGGIK